MNKFEKEKNSLEELANKQQMTASNPNLSVWVEASAGTGKTKLLSDRVLRLLLKGVNPSKILCLTYTKAAAVEMNERITKRLSNWAICSANDLENDLSKLLGEDFNNCAKNSLLLNSRTLFAQLLDSPGGMKIQTIHSFCQDILKRFPLEAGISPFFEVLDDRSSNEILQNIKTDILKKTNNNDVLGKEISYLASSISEFKFPEIMKLITDNRNKIDELLKKHKTIQTVINKLEHKLGISSHLTEEEIKNDFFANIDKDTFKECLKAFLKGGKEDQKRGKIFNKIIESNFSIENYELYKNVFFTVEEEKRAHFARKDAIKAYPLILDFMNSEFERISIADNTIKTIKLLCSTKSMLHISKNIIDAYNSYKEMYSLLDYEDLIIKTKSLLENRENTDWVLFKLDGGIDHILVDEAQDTSPNQWAIIRAITKEFFVGQSSYEGNIPRSVLVVGDRKQSIYSFQGADPNEFDKMYDYFLEEYSSFEKVHLDVSFRSTKAIMDCVNLLFEAEDVKKGVVTKGQSVKHCPFRLGEGGSVEIYSLTKQKQENEDSDYGWLIPLERTQKSSPSNLLAKKIAQNIKSMVENKEILASKNRPIRYGDFMFLVQRRNCFVEEFVRACKELEINVAGVDRLKLLEQIATQDLISLGKFLLSPYDDLSLAEVLKSPIFNLDDSDLFKLCYERKGTIFNNMPSFAQYNKILDELNILLNMSKYVRPFELYSYVLSKMDGRKNYISRMGKEVEDVLDEFLNLTIDFEQKNTPSFENFINWISKDEVIIKKEMEQSDNDTVKIMTVHGSKGLQAPIVILADTVRVKKFSRKADFFWEDSLFYFPFSSEYYNAECNNLIDVLSQIDLEEYRRLLYVALTRAEDRLYIAGYTKQKNIKDTSWYSLLENNLKSNVTQIDDDKKIVYKIEQEIPCKTKDKEQEILLQATKDYSYLLTPINAEIPMQKILSPSKDYDGEDEVICSPIEDDGNFYKRGTAIHKLLQYISNVDVENRYMTSILFLKKELPDLDDNEYDNITNEVLTLCEKYSYLFSKNAMSEVPVIGEIDDKIFSSKIDKLLVNEKEVIIVDYKTNRKTPDNINEVPKVYLSQLDCYKKLLKKIYPDKEIITYLLWTNTCNLMKV